MKATWVAGRWAISSIFMCHSVSSTLRLLQIEGCACCMHPAHAPCPNPLQLSLAWWFVCLFAKCIYQLTTFLTKVSILNSVFFVLFCFPNLSPFVGSPAYKWGTQPTSLWREHRMSGSWDREWVWLMEAKTKQILYPVGKRKQSQQHMPSPGTGPGTLVPEMQGDLVDRRPSQPMASCLRRGIEQ